MAATSPSKQSINQTQENNNDIVMYCNAIIFIYPKDIYVATKKKHYTIEVLERKSSSSSL
jgi:hypothetical protein